jgi:glycosyltransferase involved in cell wall biosynthesis
VHRSKRRGLAEPPRVGVDATSLGAFGKGVARYVRELLPALAELHPSLAPVVLAPPDAELPPGAESLEVVRVRGRPAIRWEQAELPRVARRHNLALVHTTSDRLPVVCSVPVVVYLFEDPKYRLAAVDGARPSRHLVADALTRGLFAGSMRRAAVVLVSSRATARDLEARGITARVRLVYPGVSSGFRPTQGELETAAIRERLAAPAGYVLHFSSDDPRDNTEVAFRAYAELCRRASETPPLLVPGPVVAELGAQQALASELGVRDRVRWLGFQRGDALAEIYRAASVFVDPSLYEGFGFQVAEALASGAPVVCSNATSLPEVVGDAAILEDPRDVRGFAEALGALLADSSRAAELSKSGVVQASRFTWTRTAEETVSAWQEVLA